MPGTPSLGDLTFEVDPPREWTPPHANSLESKIWDSPRTSAAYLSANPYRPNNHVRPSLGTTPDARASDAAKPLQPQPQLQPASSPPTLAPLPIQPSPADPGRLITPRKVSPPRVVYVEPSLSQLPSATPSELPSIRGQMLAFATAPSGFSGGNLPSPTGVLAGGTSRRGLTAQGAVVVLAAQHGAPGAGPGSMGVVGGPSAMMTDLLSNISSHQEPDPVETYLARFQFHQQIQETFRVKQDEHLRTVHELGAKIQAMIRPGSPQQRPAGDKKEGDGVGTAAGASNGRKPPEADGEGGEGASAATGAQHVDGTKAENPAISNNTAAILGTSTAAGSPLTSPDAPSPWTATRGPPQLPDPPLGRNRFVPLSLPVGPATSCGRRHSATSVTGDGSPRSPGPVFRAGSARPAAAGPADGTDPAAALEAHLRVGSVSQLQSQLQLAHQVQNQGAYLALPDGSFAGSAPFRAQATTEGLLFERYGLRKGPAAGPGAADLPDVQLRYLRPPTTAPLEPRVLRKLPRPPQPPVRALPNGIPASRLERLSARRRNRSPSRPYQSQQLSPGHRPELVLLSGAAVQPYTAPASLSGGGGLNSPAALEEGLLRSISMLSSPTASLPCATSGGSAGGNPNPNPNASANLDGVALASPSAAVGVPHGRNSPAAGGEGSPLAQYLASPTALGTGEPLLDDNFYGVLSQHFRSSLHQQTAQLRAQLNVNLPIVLKALNCVNVTEPLPPPAPLTPLPRPAPLPQPLSASGTRTSRVVR